MPFHPRNGKCSASDNKPALWRPHPMRALLLALGCLMYWLAQLALYLSTIGLTVCLLYFCVTAVAGVMWVDFEAMA